MSRKPDPNANPTVSELAASFFAAHEKVRDRMKVVLSEMRASGIRGFFDVGWFWPSAPLRLGSELRLTIYPVAEREAPLPFGWARYELTDATEIKVVARGVADAS